MNTDEILDLKFLSGDLHKEVTIREFFYELLKAVWEGGESFNGKKPFGNSGWTGDLKACLVKNKLIDGEIDAEGYMESCDEVAFNKLVLEKLIKHWD